MQHRHSFVAALLAVVLVVAACGSDNEVGSDELLQGSGGGEGNLSLGSTSTTAAPASDTTIPTETTVAPPTTQAPPPPTTAPPADTAALEIEIRSDDVSPQMNPSVARVFEGSTIRWRNTDSVVRSVRADDGTFASGDIPPGGTFEHTFTTPGTVNYKDGTRPYVTAQVEVLAQ